MNTLAVLLTELAVAVVVASAVVALHFRNRHRWDAETARLKARGLPWMILLILCAPVIFWVGASIGGRLGQGVFGLLLVVLLASYSRRVSAGKKWGK